MANESVSLAIDAQRLLADLDELATFGASVDGGVTRPTYSAADLAAKEWLTRRCSEDGFTCRHDAIGNFFIRLDGPPGPVVWAGSHLDSVPNGGRLDGALGVIAGLECLRTLAAHRPDRARGVEIVAFADEEGSYTSFLGSKALAGSVDADKIRTLVGRDGTSLPDALAAIGSSPDRAAAVRVDPGDVLAYVELHIEQGPVLETAGDTIGVVSEVVEVVRGELAFLGRADHAGTTPLRLRRDASRGAGYFLNELMSVPARAGSVDGVITCGKLEMVPGAINIVPAECRLQLDVRDRAGGLAPLKHEVERLAAEAAAAHDLESDVHWHTATAGAALNTELQAMIAAAATDLGLPQRSMISGAGHDAQVLAPIIPAGMIFVPSRDGRSHSAAESTEPSDIEAGANVLLAVLDGLSAAPKLEL